VRTTAGCVRANRTWLADVATDARQEHMDSDPRVASLVTAMASALLTISATSRQAAASAVPTPTAEPAASASPVSGTSRIASAVSVTDTRTAATPRPGPASIAETSLLDTIVTVALTIFTAIRGSA